MLLTCIVIRQRLVVTVDDARKEDDNKIVEKTSRNVGLRFYVTLKDRYLGRTAELLSQ